MPKYFLDTSALAKLYHSEVGSEYMDRILKETGSHFVVSRLAIVEMESVLATKVRTREIDQAGVDIGRLSLRADLVRQRLVVGPPIIARHYQVARRMLVNFGATEGLRTLDALQLAIALDLRQLGQVSLMVTADQRLSRVAPLAGCPAVNPEKPGPVLISLTPVNKYQICRNTNRAHPGCQNMDVKIARCAPEPCVLALQILEAVGLPKPVHPEFESRQDFYPRTIVAYYFRAIGPCYRCFQDVCYSS